MTPTVGEQKASFIFCDVFRLQSHKRRLSTKWKLRTNCMSERLPIIADEGDCEMAGRLNK